MIRWCAYCQNYLGEAEPFDKFSISHGLCSKCAESGIAESGDAVKRLRPLSDFFIKLRREAREGSNFNPKDWVTKAFELGIKADSILVGLVQPALYEIGELWQKGEVNVATEHRFSSFAEMLISTIYQERPELSRNSRSQNPDILLANADGNYHPLGVKFLEVSLLTAGLKTHTLLPGIPVSEIIAQTRSLKPKALGLSVSMPDQVKNIQELAREVARLPEKERPLLLVGGRQVKEGLLTPGPDIIYCRSISDFPFDRIKAQ